MLNKKSKIKNQNLDDKLISKKYGTFRRTIFTSAG